MPAADMYSSLSTDSACYRYSGPETSDPFYPRDFTAEPTYSRENYASEYMRNTCNSVCTSSSATQVTSCSSNYADVNSCDRNFSPEVNACRNNYGTQVNTNNPYTGEGKHVNSSNPYTGESKDTSSNLYSEEHKSCTSIYSAQASNFGTERNTCSNYTTEAIVCSDYAGREDATEGETSPTPEGKSSSLEVPGDLAASPAGAEGNQAGIVMLGGVIA